MSLDNNAFQWPYGILPFLMGAIWSYGVVSNRHAKTREMMMLLWYYMSCGILTGFLVEFMISLNTSFDYPITHPRIMKLEGTSAFCFVIASVFKILDNHYGRKRDWLASLSNMYLVVAETLLILALFKLASGSPV